MNKQISGNGADSNGKLDSEEIVNSSEIANSRGMVDLYIVEDEAELLEAAYSSTKRIDSINILGGILGKNRVDLEHGIILTKGPVKDMAKYPPEGYERDQVGYWIALWYGPGDCPTPCKSWPSQHNGRRETSTPQDSDFLSTFGVRMRDYEREKTNDHNYLVFTTKEFAAGVREKLENLEYIVHSRNVVYDLSK